MDFRLQRTAMGLAAAFNSFNTSSSRFLTNRFAITGGPPREWYHNDTAVWPRSSPVLRRRPLVRHTGFIWRNRRVTSRLRHRRRIATLSRETDILHEHFIPRDRFVQFVDGLREIVTSAPVPLLNASVRVVHHEDNVLTYASADDMLAVVLDVNQSTDRAGREQMDAFTRQVVDLYHPTGGPQSQAVRVDQYPTEALPLQPPVGEVLREPARGALGRQILLPFLACAPGTMVSSSSAGTALALISPHTDAHRGSSGEKGLRPCRRKPLTAGRSSGVSSVRTGEAAGSAHGYRIADCATSK